MVPSARRRRAREDDDPPGAPELVLAGRAFVGGRLQPIEIAIDADGRIQSVGRVRTGAPRHDVGDAVLLPAATDLHVHFRDPSATPAVESIASGTLQAALGGVGLVADMPNTDPPVASRDRLEEKVDRVRGRAAVDVLRYALAQDPRAVPGLASVAGAFKLFLSPTTGVPEVPSDAALPELLAALARTDLPLTVHAEAPAAFRDGAPARDPVAWNAHRPGASETAALDRLRIAPGWLRLHLAHVTLASSAAAARSWGVSCEATAHHLLLSERSGRDARFKTNPPLRSETDRAALWAAFARGEVPVLASDHAPHSADAKAAPFAAAPSGVPGVETTLPLLLARVRAGELGLGTLLAAACDRPARIVGQPVGRIAPGHRANLIVVDFRRRHRLEAAHLHAPAGWTPFEGWEAILPVEHWRDGERIVADGEYVGAPVGRVVRPEFARGPTRSGSG